MFFSGISDEAADSIGGQIKAHQELGWTHLELRNIDGVNLTDLDDAAFAQVEAAVNAAGMTVNCFASQLANWGRPLAKGFDLDLAELRQAIPRMQRMGTKYIRCMSWPNSGLSEEAWAAEVVRRMTELAKMAEDGGIVLVHENCNGWGGESSANTLALLERVNSPALKLVFDTGNPVAHNQHALNFLKDVIDHVVHVHIKDGIRKDGGKTQYTYPGEGEGFVAECLRLLLDRGYDGGYSIEPHVAAIIHTGEGVGDKDLNQVKWDSYLEYGRRFMAVYERAAGVKA